MEQNVDLPYLDSEIPPSNQSLGSGSNEFIVFLVCRRPTSKAEASNISSESNCKEASLSLIGSVPISQCWTVLCISALHPFSSETFGCAV